MDLSFIPECEVIYENGKDSDTLEDECTKHPGHSDFVSVQDFSTQHLSPENRTPDNIDALRELCDRTVHVTVNFTSPNRPATYPGTELPYPFTAMRGNSCVKRCGTGFVSHPCISEDVTGTSCPCPPCKYSGTPKTTYTEMIIYTAAHVIYDDIEAGHAVFKFFYDSEEERNGVRIAYGVGLDKKTFVYDPSLTDLSAVKCVCHDFQEQDLKRLQAIDKSKKMLLHRLSDLVLISHPHGRSKKITVGKTLHYVIPNISERGILSMFQNEKLYSVTPDFSHSQPRTSALIKETKKHLPRGTGIYIPSDAEYILKISSDWTFVKFPPNSTFWTTKGEILPLLPGAAKFHVNPSSSSQTLEWLYGSSFVIYDTPTCPGSSGAGIKPVARGDNVSWLFPLTHAGSMKDGTNRSSWLSLYRNSGDRISHFIDDIIL